MSHNIDKIIYINLDERSDRRECMESDIEKMGLTEKLERFPAIYLPGKGGYACGLSHLEVLKLARDRQYKNVLILEDDFMFLVDKATLETRLTGLFQTDFEVCMLAYSMDRSETTEWPFLTRVIDSHNAAGYLVRDCMYDKLIHLYEWALPLLDATGQHWIYSNDRIWTRLQVESRWYCFTERIGRQRPSISSISGKFADYGC